MPAIIYTYVLGCVNCTSLVDRMGMLELGVHRVAMGKYEGGGGGGGKVKIYEVYIDICVCIGT